MLEGIGAANSNSSLGCRDLRGPVQAGRQLIEGGVGGSFLLPDRDAF
jgi:hypothetical protein